MKVRVPDKLSSKVLIKKSFKSAENFQALNLIYCELMSFLALRSKSTSTNPGRSLKPTNTPTMQVSMVSDYITKSLRGQNTSISQISSSSTAGVYLALLPSIWTAINDPYPELSSHVSGVLQALLEHASKAPSKSRMKQITIEFVARLFLVSLCELKMNSLHMNQVDNH